MRIAVLSPVPTHPPNAGNRARILALVESLERRGHEVHLAYVTYESADLPAMRARFGSRLHVLESAGPPAQTRFWSKAWRYIARRLRITQALRWPVDAWYDPAIGPALASLCREHRIETVLCEYVFMSAAIASLPAGVRSAIDCHDLFADRHLMYLRSGIPPGWFSTTEREE